MTYYVGNEVSQSDILGNGNPRYFYALRRTDDGVLYFAKIDQLKDTGSIIVNDPGLAQNDYSGFDYGVDFFDGRLESDHSRPYSNLHWDEYRWDNKNCFYYINEQGEIVVRINQTYTYPPEQIVTP
jgi:hypothetical protein